jgi:hypothetical protein
LHALLSLNPTADLGFGHVILSSYANLIPDSHSIKHYLVVAPIQQSRPTAGLNPTHHLSPRNRGDASPHSSRRALVPD